MVHIFSYQKSQFGYISGAALEWVMLVYFGAIWYAVPRKIWHPRFEVVPKKGLILRDIV
jgi:hypothetical protein